MVAVRSTDLWVMGPARSHCAQIKIIMDSRKAFVDELIASGGDWNKAVPVCETIGEIKVSTEGPVNSLVSAQTRDEIENEDAVRRLQEWGNSASSAPVLQ